MDKEEDYTCDLTEEELFDLTEKLLENDENNCSQYFRYNLQERRCGEEDTCDEPLFSEVDQDALFEVPTIKTLMALHDNYIPVSSKYFKIDTYILHSRLVLLDYFFIVYFFLPSIQNHTMQVPTFKILLISKKM